MTHIKGSVCPDEPEQRRRRKQRISTIVDRVRPGPRGGLGSQLVGQSAQTTVLNISAVVLSFATTLVLTRLLGGRGYGIYVYALAWPLVLAVAAQLGYGPLLVRNLPGYTARGEWGLARGIVSHSLRVMLGASAVLMVAAGALGWRFVGIGQPRLRQSLFIALLLIPGYALVAQREAVLRGYRHVAMGRFTETVLQPVLLLAFTGTIYVFLGERLSPPHLVAATVVAVACGVLLGTVLVRRVTPAAVAAASPETDRKSWSRSARSLIAVSGLQVVNLQMSVLLLGAIESVDEAGVLSIALRWSSMVSFLQTAVVFPLAPALALLFATGSKAKIQRLVSKASRGVWLLSVPVALTLLLFSEQAMAIFGEEFRTGQMALNILVIGEVINIASGFVGIILINLGQERTLFIAVTCVTVGKIALTAALTGILGLEGAALGQAIGLGAQNLVLAAIIWRSAGIYSPAIGSRWFLRSAPLAQVEEPPTRVT